jgi:hypothetical protein
MNYFELELRLVALSDDGDRCAVWQDGEWREGSEELAAKTFVDGEQIDSAEAARRFPDADQGKMPDLDA